MTITRAWIRRLEIDELIVLIAPVECIPSEFLEASEFVDLDSLSAARVRPLYEGR